MFHKYLLLGQKNSVGAGTERERESRLQEGEERARESKKGGERIEEGRIHNHSPRAGLVNNIHAQHRSRICTYSPNLFSERREEENKEININKNNIVLLLLLI